MKKFILTLLLLWAGLSFVLPLHAQAQLKADFTVSQRAGCSPVVVEFTNTSTGSIQSYFWRLGNGNTSTKKEPGAAYYIPGNYSVTLIVSDGKGHVDSITKSDIITVYDKPEADFASSVRSGCFPLKLSFTDESTSELDSIVNWTWDFGDGTVSNQRNPQHTYLAAGNYDITLVVENGMGCKNSKVVRSFITVKDQPNADFTYSAAAACSVPLQVRFTPKDTGAGRTYLWSFGDGSTSAAEAPVHTFAKEGLFSVSLMVSDSSGCSNTYTRNGLIKIGHEKAVFLASDTLGCAPLSVSFSKGSTAPAMSGSSYFWDFGDGQSSTQAAPVHIYTKQGNYTVKLKVVSAAGCTDTASLKTKISVRATSQPAFHVSDSLACTPPLKVQFTNTSVNAKSYLWSFGDGTTSTEAQPTHTYSSWGQYTVTLKAVSENGCSNSISRNKLIVIQAPKVSLSASISRGCQPLSVSFRNTSTSVSAVKGVLWRFGNGKTSTSNNPTQTFQDTGKYKVTLIMQTVDGCTDSATTTIQVSNKPQADFTADKTKGCSEHMDVQFTNLSNTHSVQADSFFWDFGDHTYSNKENPLHFYSDVPGKYTVKLIAFHNGCADTLVKKDYIELLPPYAWFDVAQDKCHPQYVQFKDKSIGADSHYWQFGDGTTSTDISPDHVYSKPGTYVVFLTVQNKTTACSRSSRDSIIVGPELSASFSTKDTMGCIPHTVHFSANANKAVSWYWNFGDGRTSTQQNPVITLSHEGVYTVSLTVITADGCSYKVVRKDYIHTYGPTVDFGMSAAGGCAPLYVKLINRSTSTHKIVATQWDMGDGVKINDQDTIEYVYNKPAQIQKNGFNITLTLTDSLGCKRSMTKTIYPSHPRPDFTLATNPSCGAVVYHFYPVDNDFNGIGPFTYSWDFGDGTTSSLRQPVKAFNQSGSYRVVLKLTDKYGCSDTISKKIDVKVLYVKAGFKATPMVTSCPPARVSFFDTSHIGFSKIVQYDWDFGDGTHSSLRNPEKLYRVAGQFHVSLKVTDSLGCTDSFMLPQPVIVKGPIGTYSVDKNIGCMPLPVHFTAVTKNASRITWDMGDGTLLYGNKVSYTYANAGTYVPLLILSDSTGCTYTLPARDTIRVMAKPKPDFSFVKSCANSATEFSVQPQGINADQNIIGWNWNFGDGNTSVQRDPSHAYGRAGTYSVSLTLTNKAGCSESITKKVRIMGVTAAFSHDKVSTCASEFIRFQDQSQADTTITSWYWSFGDGGHSTEQNPAYRYAKKGIYAVSLMVETANGCRDTVSYGNIMYIGDTAALSAPEIYRVNVLSDNSLRLRFSAYRGFDFKGYRIYRHSDDNKEFQLLASVSDPMDTIYVDNAVDALHHSYTYKVTVINLCETESRNSISHTSMNLSAAADTNAAVLAWNPYAGWKVQTYKIYREDVYVPGSFKYLATVSGGITAYRDTQIMCYRTHRYKIQAIGANDAVQYSWSDTAATTPIYVPHLPGMALVVATVEQDKEVKVRWQLPATDRVKYLMLERTTDGQSYQVIDNTIRAGQSEYTDVNVDVHQQPYQYRVRYTDSCGDVSQYSNIGKSILLKVDNNNDGQPFLHWSAYQGWSSGVKYYEIQLKNAQGSFETIARTQDGKKLYFEDHISNLNTMPQYIYRIIAHENSAAEHTEEIVSVSNEASAPVESHVWIPNAFSPNGDGLNDQLEVKGQYVKDFHMVIYNRWGELMFESNSMTDMWDGTFHGTAAPEGAYVYSVLAHGADNQPYYLKGTITIIK